MFWDAPLRFTDLERRLLALLRSQVAQGHLSPTSIARRTRYSQPAISNILAGRRRLTIASADALMIALQLTIADLLSEPPPPAVMSIERRRRRRNARMHTTRPHELVDVAA